MNTLLFYLSIYVFGGITFIPLIFALLIWFLSWYLPQADLSNDESKHLETKSELDEYGVTHPEINYDDLKAGEFEERLNSGVDTYATGWLTVTTEYYQLSQNHQPKDSNNDGDDASSTQLDEKPKSPSTYAQLYKFVKGDKNNTESSKENPEPETKSLKNVRKKNRYFAVLKHGNLFLYKNDDCKNVQHVIVLNNSVVSLWPRDLKEGELFGKRSAICIMKKEFPRSPNGKNGNTAFEVLTQEATTSREPPKDSFFIYSDYNCEKEDWYFNLIRATKRTYFQKDTEEDVLESTVYARTSFFKSRNMIDLIQTLNSSEGQLTTKWLNALMGRVFLGLHNTKEFHDFVKSKVEKKLMKIKKPGFLDDFQIEKINVGDSGPFITFPKLERLSPEGDLEVVANLLYQGGLSIQIATKANINLGSRFKAREVNLVLTVKLVKLSGQLLFKIKPPPSNRVWYGFTAMPDMDLEIEPVVSARQLTYNVVTKAIGNKFRDAIRESLVVPYMDEFPIYNTEDEVFRGGIWDKESRKSVFRKSQEQRQQQQQQPQQHQQQSPQYSPSARKSYTFGNDGPVNGDEDSSADGASGSEEYGKPSKSETFPLDAHTFAPAAASGAATAFNKLRPSSVVSHRSNRSNRSDHSNVANAPTTASINSEVIDPVEHPQPVPANLIPDVVEKFEPNQVHRPEAVYRDINDPSDQSSSSASKISKQMKKVFKNKNDSSESVASSQSTNNSNGNGNGNGNGSSENGMKSLPNTQNISSSIKKIGKWYNKAKDNRGVEVIPDQILGREKSYAPPEMIRYRRERNSSANEDDAATAAAATAASAVTRNVAQSPISPGPAMFKKQDDSSPSMGHAHPMPKRVPPPSMPPSLPPRENTAQASAPASAPAPIITTSTIDENNTNTNMSPVSPPMPTTPLAQQLIPEPSAVPSVVKTPPPPTLPPRKSSAAASTDSGLDVEPKMIQHRRSKSSITNIGNGGTGVDSPVGPIAESESNV